jgi:hypothetical protein
VRRKGRLSPELNPVGDRTSPALTGTGADQIALELCQAAKDSQHQPSMRRRRIGPGVVQRPEAGPLFGDRSEDIQKIACRPCQTIESRHHEDIARLKIRDRSTELDSLTLCAARRLAPNLLRPKGTQLLDLCFKTLAVRRYPCVAYNHACILLLYSALENSFQIKAARKVQKS